MKFRRFFSASAAALMAASALPAMSIVSYAEEKYDAEDYVFDVCDKNNERGYLFFVNGELNEKVLDVFEKYLKKDYDEITFGDLDKIYNLDLSGLELEGVPLAVEYMHRLRTLDLSENMLRNADVNNLDFSSCIYLTSIDISNNYLTSVPSWYLSLNLSKKDISDNLIGTTGQRYVKLPSDTYYFMLDDAFNENAFKDKLLSTLKLSDGTALPYFFYDPELPTYDIPERDEDDEDEDYEDEPVNQNVYVDIDVDKYVKDGKVTATGTVTGEIGIYTASSGNSNAKTTFKLHFLDGNAPSTIRIKLETLIGECGAIEKSEYTTGSWTAFEAALKSAQTILAYTGADADMIKTALDSLTEAKGRLIEGVSADTKKTLNDLLSIAKTFKEQDYSEASWKKFDKAVKALQDAVNNTETSIIDANSAIKAYQTALSGLTETLMSVPAVITKAEFEAIYGDDRIVSAKGTTRSGYKYSVVFNGNDITAPADFNPEIKYESQQEESIRFEVGSASDYHLVSFAQSGKFPGTALVTLDVSGVYEEGTYRLYKCNGSGSKSEFVKEVTIADGEVEFTVSEGGDYFISSVLQNFQMISSNFNINHEKLTITSKFGKKYTVADFRDSIENGEAVAIKEADGGVVFDHEYISTGMTATAANSDVSYTIVVMGDCDGDGNITALDSVQILSAIVGEEGALSTYASKVAADVNGDGWVRTDDAVAILKYVIGIE